MRRHLDIEKAQALQRRLDTLWLFRFYEMKNDFEAVSRCFVDSRGAPGDQLRNQSLGLVEVPAQ